MAKATVGHKAAFWAGKILGTLGRALPGLIRDGAGLAGAAAIAYGAWLIYVPAGFIAGGILLILGAWLHARNEGAE